MDVKKFNENKEYRNKVLQVLNSLCMKGVDVGLTEKEEKLRIEINKIVNAYYFKRWKNKWILLMLKKKLQIKNL